MSLWGKIVRCEIEDKCCYQDFIGENKRKCCRILITKDGDAPYKDKCPYYKEHEKDFSGGKFYGIDKLRESLSGKDKDQ